VSAKGKPSRVMSTRKGLARVWVPAIAYCVRLRLSRITELPEHCNDLLNSDTVAPASYGQKVTTKDSSPTCPDSGTGRLRRASAYYGSTDGHHHCVPCHRRRSGRAFRRICLLHPRLHSVLALVVGVYPQVERVGSPKWRRSKAYAASGGEWPLPTSLATGLHI
jgi:hypothetical protein